MQLQELTEILKHEASEENSEEFAHLLKIDSEETEKASEEKNNLNEETVTTEDLNDINQKNEESSPSAIKNESSDNKQPVVLLVDMNKVTPKKKEAEDDEKTEVIEIDDTVEIDETIELDDTETTSQNDVIEIKESNKGGRRKPVFPHDFTPEEIEKIRNIRKQKKYAYKQMSKMKDILLGTLKPFEKHRRLEELVNKWIPHVNLLPFIPKFAQKGTNGEVSKLNNDDTEEGTEAKTNIAETKKETDTRKNITETRKNITETKAKFANKTKGLQKGKIQPRTVKSQTGARQNAVRPPVGKRPFKKSAPVGKQPAQKYITKSSYRNENQLSYKNKTKSPSQVRKDNLRSERYKARLQERKHRVAERRRNNIEPWAAPLTNLYSNAQQLISHPSVQEQLSQILVSNVLQNIQPQVPAANSIFQAPKPQLIENQPNMNNQRPAFHEESYSRKRKRERPERQQQPSGRPQQDSNRIPPSLMTINPQETLSRRQRQKAFKQAKQNNSRSNRYDSPSNSFREQSSSRNSSDFQGSSSGLAPLSFAVPNPSRSQDFQREPFHNYSEASAPRKSADFQNYEQPFVETNTSTRSNNFPQRSGYSNQKTNSKYPPKFDSYEDQYPNYLSSLSTNLTPYSSMPSSSSGPNSQTNMSHYSKPMSNMQNFSDRAPRNNYEADSSSGYDSFRNERSSGYNASNRNVSYQNDFDNYM